MKVFVPRNIEKWRLNMNFQVGPLNVSLVQLVLIAVWAWISLMVRNGLVKTGVGKVTAIVMVSPILGIFWFIAFFKISELSLIPYLAKVWRTRFLDTNKKFQRNTTSKIDPQEVAIKQTKAMYEDTQTQEVKTLDIEKIKENQTKSSDLLS